MKDKRQPLQFVGISDFNNPIFKTTTNRTTVFFGSLHVLFPWGTTEAEVLASVDETDLCVWGYAYDCDPMGHSVNPSKIRIIKPLQVYM